MDQKRAHTRKGIRVEINCLVNFGKNSIAGLTYNIGEGGICLISNKPLPEGSTVDLDFKIPFTGRIVAVAEVKWNKELYQDRYSNGLQFMSIKKKDLESLKNYLMDIEKKKKPKDERRKAKRVDLGVFVNYMTIEAYAIDISESGIRIETAKEMKPDQEIQLMFFLPDLTCVMIKGTIVWCEKITENQFEFGLKFIESHAKDIDAIRKFIEKNRL